MLKTDEFSTIKLKLEGNNFSMEVFCRTATVNFVRDVNFRIRKILERITNLAFEYGKQPK